MQLAFTPKTVFICAVVVTAGYFGYRMFLSDIQTDDVAALIRIHRTSPGIKQVAVKKRILALYDHDTHYQLLYEAVDDSSPVTQVLAIEVLTEKGEEDALGKFVNRLNAKPDDPGVDRALAEAMGAFHENEVAVGAVDRLIELTEADTDHKARVAAHNALVAILESGAQVKFGDGMTARWAELWRTHRKHKAKGK
jgi:hypothetical protein